MSSLSFSSKHMADDISQSGKGVRGPRAAGATVAVSVGAAGAGGDCKFF